MIRSRNTQSEGNCCMAYEFKLPDIGEGVSEGEIVQWLVGQGDSVEEDQPIVEVMTDKATVEIASPKKGVIEKTFGASGENVKVGAPLALIQTGSSDSSQTTSEKNQTERVSAPASSSAPKDVKPVFSSPIQPMVNGHSPADASSILASPYTRKLAREKGIDLNEVRATGDHGRVTLEDVKQHVTGSSSSTGSTSKNTVQHEERIPLKGIRKVIAQNMRKSVDHAAHFSHMDELDATGLVDARNALKELAQDQGIKLSYLPFLVKSLCAALKQYPMLNASLDEEQGEIVVKHYYNIGIAVATKDEDLVVPVIHNADQMGLLEIAQNISSLAKKAQEGKLSPNDLQGGTFTITSLGTLAGTYATPIINYPQVGILGFYAIKERPVVRNGEIVARQMANVSVSIDHRVVDGALGAKFTKALISYLETPASLLL
ncbi:MAG: dihydrolipoamide acetyltransferase family protein [Bdellovibrionota bacterium]